MSVKKEHKIMLLTGAVFALCFFLPVEQMREWTRLKQAVWESLYLVKWYAREHVLLCLVPAFFIAGAIAVFVSQASVMKYLGFKANKVLAYCVASVSGSVLAVCSCTVLPLFAGIHRMGAGLGPACAFLYSGPAINVLAIILTARVLGYELGVARAVGAIVFSIVIGLLMTFFFRREEMEKANRQVNLPDEELARPLWKNTVFFALMVAILVFANWGAPGRWNYVNQKGDTLTVDIVEAPFDPHEADAVYVLRPEDRSAQWEFSVPAGQFLENRKPLGGLWTTVWSNKWLITSAFALLFALIMILWFRLSWWKVFLTAMLPAVLIFILPLGGLWNQLPFLAAVLAFSFLLSRQEGEGKEWVDSSWSFAKQILPLLLIGVLIAGFLLGRPGSSGLIPAKYVQMLVGENPDMLLGVTGWGGGAYEPFVRLVWPAWTNLFAAVFGAFMYFATLTEIPILQGLLGAGMGKGPALALLLAGPALSLPNMLVIRSVLGTRKTLVFCSLVVVMAAISGFLFDLFVS